MSARSSIVHSLVAKLKEVNGITPYLTNFYNNVTHKLKFWDEVNDFPYICVVAGYESREYLPSNFKWGNLSIAIKVYVKGEDPVSLLEDVMQDIELVIDNNQVLEYETGKETTNIDIVSIITDEGLLAPFGVGDINLSVKYQIMN